MENWLTHTDILFANIDFDKIDIEQTDFYTYKTYRKNGTYISIDFVDNFKKIRKIESGKYWLTEDNKWGFEINNIKAVLNKNKENYIDFLQTSFDGEDGKEFQLSLSKEDKTIFNKFMNILLYSGWTELLYSLKNEIYKSVIYLNSPKLTKEIPLMHFAEQDMPMLGDKLSIKINKWWADLSINNKNRTFEEITIKPLKRTKA